MAMSTETAAKPFAILGQRKLHTQAEIVHARGHNNREEEVGNVIVDAPEPRVVLGPVDAWQGVKDRLGELGIEPRKGAVLALELMMTTSPEWWLRDADGAVNEMQLLAFERMAMKYLRQRFVPEALVSVTLHNDESTPHYHAIACPVRQRIDQRFASKGERWTLCARGDLIPKMAKEDRPAFYASAWRGGIGGRGHMAYEQTRFAEVMAPLKLARGKVWSGAPNKPNAEHQAELRAGIAAVGVERAGLQDARMDIIIDEARQREEAAELKRQREELDAERAGWAASIEAREAALVAGQHRLDADARALEDRRAAEKAWVAKKNARESDLVRREQEADKVLTDAIARRDGLVDLTATTTRVLASIDPDQLPAPARTAFFAAAHDLRLSVTSVSVDPVFAGMLAARQAWKPISAANV